MREEFSLFIYYCYSLIIILISIQGKSIFVIIFINVHNILLQNRLKMYFLKKKKDNLFLSVPRLEDVYIQLKLVSFKNVVLLFSHARFEFYRAFFVLAM